MKKLLIVLFVTLALTFVLTPPVYAIPEVQSHVLQWDQNQDADGYMVGVIDRQAFPGNDIVTEQIMIYDVPGGNNCEVVINEIVIFGSPLNLDTPYQFIVKAYNACGNTSDWGGLDDPANPIIHTIDCAQSAEPLGTPVSLQKTVRTTPMFITININGQVVEVKTGTEPHDQPVTGPR